MSRSFVDKDLLATLADRGVDLNVARLWVIDGSKALRSAIEQRCGDAAKVQRCRIHKIESPNSVVCRVSRRVTNYKDAEMAGRGNGLYRIWI